MFCCLVACFKIVGFYAAVLNEVITGIKDPAYEKLLLAAGVLSWGNDILLASGLAWCIWVREKDRTFRE